MHISTLYNLYDFAISASIILFQIFVKRQNRNFKYLKIILHVSRYPFIHSPHVLPFISFAHENMEWQKRDVCLLLAVIVRVPV
jgi:hypothetical protein